MTGLWVEFLDVNPIMSMSDHVITTAHNDRSRCAEQRCFSAENDILLDTAVLGIEQVHMRYVHTQE